MRRIDLDYIVVAGLLLSGVYVFVTGAMTDLLGLHQFAFHRYAGYISAALATLHVLLNWGRITAYLGWKVRALSIRNSPKGHSNPAPLSRRGFIHAVLSAGGGFVMGRLFSAGPSASPEDPALDLGALYHLWSTPGNTLELGGLPDWGAKPGRYKRYQNAAKTSLPDPRGHQGISLEAAIAGRRSRRSYTGQPLSLMDLSRLLHAAQGITDPDGIRRAAPSAGALYPIELYAAVHNVAGLEAGIYHHGIEKHELALLRPGSFQAAVMRAGVWQDFLATANVCLILSAIFQRTRWKYQERTYRYVFLEAGHIGQNISLAATSMGLGACAVGAFLDDELNAILGLDGQEEAAIYIISIGKI